MSYSLYEIQAELGALLEEIAEAGGEITPEQEEALDSLNLSRDVKLENWIKYLRNLKALEAGIDAEIGALEKKRASLRRHAEWSKGRLGALLGGPGSKWRGAPGFSLSWKRTEATEPLMPLESMREIFLRIVEKREFNRTSAKDYIKANGPIPEAEIVERYHLQIT
jgi:uncharacterized protein YhaN